MSEGSQNLLDQVEPLLVGIEGLASMMSISVSAVKGLERAGQIGPMPIELGTLKRKLYSVCELREWTKAKCPTREIWQGTKD